MEQELYNIFQDLDDESLCNARLVCRRWRDIIDSGKFWWLRVIKNELLKTRLAKINSTWTKKGWKKLIKHIFRKASYPALVQFGVLIQTNQKRPLHLIHFCSTEGFCDLLDILLPYIESKDLILDLGWQPLPLYFALSYAARDGQLQVLKTFVRHYGDSVFVDFQKQYPNGRLSPLYYALRNEDTEMIEYLLSLPMPTVIVEDLKQKGILNV